MNNRKSFKQGFVLVGLHIILILAMMLQNIPAAAEQSQQGDHQAVNPSTSGTPELPQLTETSPVITEEPGISIQPEETQTQPVKTTEPTVTETPTITEPESTPSPTATETPLFPTPTVTSLPTEESKPAPITPTLILSSSELIPLPDEVFTLTWSITPTLAETGYSVLFELPKEIDPIDPKMEGFDHPTHSLTINVIISNGNIPLKISESAHDSISINATLLKESKEISSASYNLMFEGISQVDAAGGLAKGLSDRVKAEFPAQALGEGAIVSIREPSDNTLPPTTLSGHPFEIVAKGLASKAAIDHFSEPITITVSYNQDELWGNEDGLVLKFFNEATQDWEILPSKVDKENNLLIGYSDHLTVFDYTIETMEAARLPKMYVNTNDKFTGAATYSIDIWTPPGPGGLQPSLSLNYNSQVVDSAFKSNQASWVGMGWSLDTGYVERNINGTHDDTGDDTFSLTLGGSSMLLLKDSSGYYHSSNENFLRIKFDTTNNQWIVWDKSGNTYTFGHVANQIKYRGDRHGRPGEDMWWECVFDGNFYWRWSLTKVRNPFGQEITYTYTTETKGPGNCAGTTPRWGGDIAVYPNTITYPNNRYRVRFMLQNNRYDYKSDWLQPVSTVVFQRSKLSEIIVEQDPNGSGSFIQLRRYAFNYATNNPILPYYQWSAGGKTLALANVQEYGIGNSGPLPTTTFTYGADKLHLWKVENGYGGKVEFTYDRWNNLEGDITRIFDFGRMCSNTDFVGWVKHGSGTLTRDCLNRTYLRFNGAMENSMPDYFFWWGGVYRVQLGATAYGGTTIKAGIYLTTTLDQWTPDNSLPITYTNEMGGDLFIPVSDAVSNAKILLSSNGASIDKYRLTLLPVRYRVVTKKIYTGGSDNPRIFTYRYDEAAMNDKSHSAAANTTSPYIDPNSQFRGHASVQEVGPDGRVDTSWFNQADSIAGQPNTELIGSQTLYEPFNTLNTNQWVYTQTGGLITTTRTSGDLALKLYNPNDNWNVQTARLGNSIQDTIDTPSTILTQFKLSGANSKTVLALTNDQGTYRWGIKIESNTIQVEYNDGSGYFYHATNMSNFKKDTWYLLQLTIDEQANLVRIRERDNPSVGESYSYHLAIPNGQAWHFKAWARNGTVWLDEYSEGKVYTLQETILGSTNILSPTMPVSTTGTYTGLTINWTRPISDTTYDFNGDGEWIAKRNIYQYDPAKQGNKQYGNLTGVLEQSGTNQSLIWNDFRLSSSSFYPISNTNTYIVGLPGLQEAFACINNSTDTACWTANQSRQKSVQPWYDNHTSYSQSPSSGILTAKRNLVDTDGGEHYQDEHYAYDSWGNQTTVDTYSEKGSSSTFASQVAGVKTYTTTTAYDSVYHTYPVFQVNPEGQPTLWSYNTQTGLPSEEFLPSGSIARANYDGFGRLLGLSRGDGVLTQTMSVSYTDSYPFHIDASQVISGSQSFSLTKYYNGLGELIQSQTNNAKVNGTDRDIIVNQAYDAYGRVVQKSVPSEVSALSGYIAPSWTNYVETQYDVLGRITKVINTDHTEQTFVYTPTNELPATNVIAATNEKGYQTTTTSDIWGRTINVNPPTGPGVDYSYDAFDQLKQVERGGATTTMQYDLAGRKTSMDDPDMGVWSYAYDARGSLSQQMDARGCQTNLSYDSLGRLTNKNYSNCPATASVTNVYDGMLRKDTFSGTSLPTGWNAYVGNGSISVSNDQVHITGGNAWTTYIYRNQTFGEEKQIHVLFQVNSTSATGHIYFDNGTWAQADYRRWSLTLTGGYITRQYYEGTSGYGQNLMALKAATWYEAILSVNKSGLFRLMVWEKNNPAVYAQIGNSFSPATWGNKNWKSAIWMYSGTMDVDQYQEQSSGGIGQRTKMQDGSGSTSWQYNLLGQVITTTQTITATGGLTGTFTTGFSYNKAGLLSSMTYPGGNAGQSGEVVTYNYLNQKVLSSLIGTSTYVYSTNYDAAGRVKLRILGSSSGPRTQYGYYDWSSQGGRLSTIQSGTNQTPTSVQDLIYHYDQVGNVETITDTLAGPQIQHFTYDELSRLTTADATGGISGTYQEAYTYDLSTGNLASKAGINYQYLDTNHKHAVTHLGDIQKYWYDENGNMITRNTSESYTLSYDAENRMTQASWQNGAKNAHFLYNGDGNRVRGQVITDTAIYIGNYYEWDGTTATKYYYAGASRIAMRKGNDLRFIFSDHLGSTSKITDENGNEISQARYKAWGEERYTSGISPTNFGYTGQRQEEGLGLYFYNARWYDPTLGRFIQADTFIPNASTTLAFDRYAYSFSNPLLYKDPSGHWLESAIDIASIAYDVYDISANGLNWENGISLAVDVGCLALPVVAGGGVLVRAVSHADDAVDAARASDRIVSLSDDAIEFGLKLMEDLKTQSHHIISDKYKTLWTPLFEGITKKYGKLDDLWNLLDIPQSGRHAEQYHEWIMDALEQIDKLAKGDLDVFMEYFNKYVRDVVKENPYITKNEWWEKYGAEFWEWWADVIKNGLSK